MKLLWLIIYIFFHSFNFIISYTKWRNICSHFKWYIYIVWWTWTRVFSSLKKLKTRWGGRGSQREVAALTIIPQGWPGSLLLRTDTRTPLLLTSDNWGKSSFPVMLNIPQKFFTILWESFIMLLLPSGKLSTGKSHH